MSQFNKRLASFKWAFNGLRILFKEEFNAKVHLIATVVVLCLGTFFRISRYEWMAILIAVALVICTELVNTAMEHLADFVSPERRLAIKKVKDLAAAAVLLAAIVALLIGLIVFVPRIINRLF